MDKSVQRQRRGISAQKDRQYKQNVSPVHTARRGPVAVPSVAQARQVPPAQHRQVHVPTVQELQTCHLGQPQHGIIHTQHQHLAILRQMFVRLTSVWRVRTSPATHAQHVRQTHIQPWVHHLVPHAQRPRDMATVAPQHLHTQAQHRAR